MGGGRFDVDTYSRASASRKASGVDDFAYSNTTAASVPRSQWKAAASLDPLGVKVRESRDSVDHPEAVPVAVFLDVTGSMRTLPQEIQKQLPFLLDRLVDSKIVEHPHIMFGAIDDATCTTVPLQVSQFEADNRIDDQLREVLMVGGGGGSGQESYELALYFMARHTVHDHFEKRGQKGFVFIIGDEEAYPEVKYDEINRVIDGGVQTSVPFADILAEAQNTYHVFFLCPATASDGGPRMQAFWKKHLGQNFTVIPDVDHIVDVIANTIAATP